MLAALTLATVLSGPALADSPRATPLKFEIVSATMFKNGYAVVTREAPISASGDYVADELPTPAAGTLWITSTPGTTIQSVIHGFNTEDTNAQIGDLDELLARNVGKTVVLALKDHAPVSGKIVSASGSLVVLDEGPSRVAVAKALVQSFTTKDALTTQVPIKRSKDVLRFKVLAGANPRIRMIGLEAGLSWTPAYSFDISNKASMDLTQKATITDDIGLISNRMVRLTTGFPELPYALTVDPLFAPFYQPSGDSGGGFGGGQVLGGAQGRGLIPPGINYFNYDPNDNSIVVRGSQQEIDDLRRNVQRSGGFGGTQSFAPDTQPPAPASNQMPLATSSSVSNEDVFFYNLPDVSINRCERGYFVIQEEKCPFEDLYVWDASSTGAQEIWHTIKFLNSLSKPLTKAPVTVYKDGELIGQGSLDFTPAGGRGSVQLAKAPDITGDIGDEELGREKAVLKIPGHGTYDRVTGKLSLIVKNSSLEEVTVRVTKDVIGEITVDDKGVKLTKKVRDPREVNPHTTVEWTVTIPAGRTQTLILNYREYYIS